MKNPPVAFIRNFFNFYREKRERGIPVDVSVLRSLRLNKSFILPVHGFYPRSAPSEFHRVYSG